MVMAGNGTRGCQPQERGPAIRRGGSAGRLGDGPDLVPGDGFPLQQGSGELGEGLRARRHAGQDLADRMAALARPGRIGQGVIIRVGCIRARAARQAGSVGPRS